MERSNVSRERLITRSDDGYFGSLGSGPTSSSRCGAIGSERGRNQTRGLCCSRYWRSSVSKTSCRLWSAVARHRFGIFVFGSRRRASVAEADQRKEENAKAVSSHRTPNVNLSSAPARAVHQGAGRLVCSGRETRSRVCVARNTGGLSVSKTSCRLWSAVARHRFGIFVGSSGVPGRSVGNSQIRVSEAIDNPRNQGGILPGVARFEPDCSTSPEHRMSQYLLGGTDLVEALADCSRNAS